MKKDHSGTIYFLPQNVQELLQKLLTIKKYDAGHGLVNKHLPGSICLVGLEAFKPTSSEQAQQPDFTF